MQGNPRSPTSLSAADEAYLSRMGVLRSEAHALQHYAQPSLLAAPPPRSSQYAYNGSEYAYPPDYASRQALQAAMSGATSPLSYLTRPAPPAPYHLPRPDASSASSGLHDLGAIARRERLSLSQPQRYPSPLPQDGRGWAGPDAHVASLPLGGSMPSQGTLLGSASAFRASPSHQPSPATSLQQLQQLQQQQHSLQPPPRSSPPRRTLGPSVPSAMGPSRDPLPPSLLEQMYPYGASSLTGELGRPSLPQHYRPAPDSSMGREAYPSPGEAYLAELRQEAARAVDHRPQAMALVDDALSRWRLDFRRGESGAAIPCFLSPSGRLYLSPLTALEGLLSSVGLMPQRGHTSPGPPSPLYRAASPSAPPVPPPIKRETLAFDSVLPPAPSPAAPPVSAPRAANAAYHQQARSRFQSVLSKLPLQVGATTILR